MNQTKTMTSKETKECAHGVDQSEHCPKCESETQALPFSTEDLPPNPHAAKMAVSRPQEPAGGLQLGFANLSASELSGLDTGKLEALLRMKREEEDRQALRQFNADLAAFQSEVPQIPMRGEGNHKAPYALTEDIRKVIDPLLTRRGMSISFGALDLTEGVAKMTCTIRHPLGHSMTESVALPVASDLRANDSQKAGSAASYCQRYLLKAILGLVFGGEDDDGVLGGTETITEEQANTIREQLDQIPKERLEKFWKWAGCSNVDDIPARKGNDAIRSLGKIINPEGGAE